MQAETLSPVRKVGDNYVSNMLVISITDSSTYPRMDDPKEKVCKFMNMETNIRHPVYKDVMGSRCRVAESIVTLATHMSQYKLERMAVLAEYWPGQSKLDF